MYGAMRERAPASTRLSGVVSAAAMTLAMGFALANGMGVNISAMLPEPIVYVPLPDTTPPADPPPTSEHLEVSSEDRLTIVEPIVIPTTFQVEDTRIAATTDAPVRANPGPSVPTPPNPPSAPIRTSAKMLPAASPTYPPSDVRKGNEGTTGLDVCLDARGRVTSAALASTSGHITLDNAALKWVRDLKFTPAKVDGVAQAICGHSVVYEWTLNKR